MSVHQLFADADPRMARTVAADPFTVTDAAALAHMPQPVVNALRHGAGGDAFGVTLQGMDVTVTLAAHDVEFTVDGALSAWDRLREAHLTIATECLALDAAGPVLRRARLPEQFASLSWRQGGRHITVGSLTTSSSQLQVVPSGRAS